VAGIVFLDGMFIWSSSPSIDKWVLDRDAVDRLRLLFRKVSTDFESPLTEMHGEDHHVHRVVRYPPLVAISKLVNSLKGASSRMLQQERPDLARRYWRGVLSSPSNFAARCGGAPGQPSSYVEQQEKPR